MTHNDIFRRLRYIFSLSDSKVISFFDLAAFDVTRTEISDWLKKDDHEDYKKMRDTMLAVFLNGLIIEKRGKQDGAYPDPEKRLNNNIIFRKLKIALTMQDDDVIAVMDLAGFPISKHELSAFFRKPDHKNFRECKDQVLRNFLKGLQIHLVDKKTLVKTDAANRTSRSASKPNANVRLTERDNNPPEPRSSNQSSGESSGFAWKIPDNK
ncbi:DUF1456 family protein [Marinicellulosiphila megalodicopiae]|uniref:DUF1456 family protein n=1 Tax=Marinicellulosiphila megalodicopiae TaxID=2724896 RepID=UPI003BB05C95